MKIEIDSDLDQGFVGVFVLTFHKFNLIQNQGGVSPSRGHDQQKTETLIRRSEPPNLF
jgi:hypothetical protein